MDDMVQTGAEAVERMRAGDTSLRFVDLAERGRDDVDVNEFIECLGTLNHKITHVNLSGNSFTDAIGVKIAQIVAQNRSIAYLHLAFNLFTEKTLLALAAAMRTNKTLRYLYLHRNAPMDLEAVEWAFVDTLRVYRACPLSIITLRGYSNDLFALLDKASELGHPSLQMLLNE